MGRYGADLTFLRPFFTFRYAGWPFDLHNPKGMSDPSHAPFDHHQLPYMFSTPLRSLISKDLTNLLFAGP